MRLIDTLKQQASYHVRLAADGHGIEWLDGQGDTQRVLTRDPDADAWTRFKVDLLSPLIPESLL